VCINAARHDSGTAWTRQSMCELAIDMHYFALATKCCLKKDKPEKSKCKKVEQVGQCAYKILWCSGLNIVAVGK
jgi:hypothetical protein